MGSKEGVSSPRVTVLMPAYNAAAFIGQAIDSILNQTFRDFELLVVDDGSQDATAEVVQSYDDARIRMVRNTANLGVIRTLNRGLDLARGEYLARMDADDVSLPTRLEKQVRFLDAHPEIGLCGTPVDTFGERKEHWWHESDPQRLKCRMLFEIGLAHTTVMFRRSVSERYGLRYDPRYPHAEDYELWARFADVTGIANLPEVLVHYRLHAESVSHANRDVQMETANAVRLGQLAKLGIRPTPMQLSIHSNVLRGAPHTLKLDLDECESWLITLLEANSRMKYCDQNAMAQLFYEIWFKLCRAHRDRLRSAGLRFLASPLAQCRGSSGRLLDAFRLLSRGR